MRHSLLTALLWGAFNAQLHAQGTALTYQGRLIDGGDPVHGTYDLAFQVFNAPSGGASVGSGVTANGVVITNGLFTVTLDPGAGVFDGSARWLRISVRTNGGSFTDLSPRQPLTPTPYAAMANSASNLLGRLPAAQLSGAVANGQLANNSVTISAGAGLSGGGAVALGGTTTLNNTGILSVTGNPDITASTVNGAVTLGHTATSANTAGAIVKRDAGGSFSAGSVTLAGSLNLPATTPSAGIIYSGGNPFIHADTLGNFFAGTGAGKLTTGGGNNSGVGYQALGANTDGVDNTAVGAQALSTNTTGSYNTAIGKGALLANTNGTQNTAIGDGTLAGNTAGNYNTAVGAVALFSNTTGSRNTANGYMALALNTSGSNNIALGYRAGRSLMAGSGNICIGNEGFYTDTNTIRIGSDQTSTYIAGNAVRLPGMLRLGSETNTASGPDYPAAGLLIRRISSTSQTSGTLIARTDDLQLQRDGTASGLRLSYTTSQKQTINAIGITTDGTQIVYRNYLDTTGSGTLSIFPTPLRVVHYDISFGSTYLNGHTCHVILDRYDDGGAVNDNYLIGTVTTTYDQ